MRRENGGKRGGAGREREKTVTLKKRRIREKSGLRRTIGGLKA